jgi:hypothetical protein
VPEDRSADEEKRPVKEKEYFLQHLNEKTDEKPEK